MSIEIRPAIITDACDIAAVHLAGWQGAYGGIVDQEYLDGLDVVEKQAQWEARLNEDESSILVAVDDDGQEPEQENKKIVGFVSCGALRTPPPGTSKIRPLYSAEIYALYLLPQYYRRGIGRALMVRAVEELQTRKHASLCLWVLDKNKRGCDFYQAMGGQRIGKHMIEIGPTKAKEVCYGWRNIKDILNG